MYINYSRGVIYIMYITILKALFALGVLLLFLNLRNLPILEGLFIFLLTSYIAVILGVIVVEEGMLDYPVTLFKGYFRSSLLFEMLLLPNIFLYFYRTTFHSSPFQIVIQSAIYSSALTIVEYLLERHTLLIEYHTWTWTYTLISMFLFLLLIRSLIAFIRQIAYKTT